MFFKQHWRKILAGLVGLFVLGLIGGWVRVQLSRSNAADPAQLLVSGVVFNSDSTARLSRSAASKVQVPGTILSPTTGWVAVRMRMGFPATTGLSPDPVIWDLSQSDPADLFVYYDVGSDTFHFSRGSGLTGGKNLASGKQTFVSGQDKTIVAAWTATTLKISVDGGPFVSAAATAVPAQSAFLIGSTNVQGSGRQPDSDYHWVAAGTGTLTDEDVAQIASFGNADKPRVTFPGTAIFIWWANSVAFNNDGDAQGENADLNRDGKVDVIDLGILLSNWNSTAKPVSDLNQDGKVDVIDLGILLARWSI